MSRTSKYNIFWKLAGEDEQILANSETSLQRRFALSGLIIVLLFATAVVSYHHTFNQIFNIPNLSWVWSLLFSLMIFNIYKLNLITISANPNKRAIGYLISLVFRIGIMILLGLTIIKPIETLFLKNTLAIELAHVKHEEIKQATAKTAAHFDAAIALNDRELNRINQQLIDGRIQISPDKIEQLKSKKLKLISDKKALIEDTERRIDASPHYVRGLIHLNYKHPWVWFISASFLFLFLLPLFLKYFISRSTSYDQIRSELNRNIILDEYENLKQLYPLLLKKNIGRIIELEEHYEDPPFNLIPKKITRKTGTEYDFLEYLNGL
ncbi:DUF4407 domain-containing protein [uncultured Zobellia sp.]|uniref:DUF4407 domain-containing protein n=1 Tax=uncultured Zobellia sp. TaxID=255433 RepID=UPI002591D7F1|nr:DUF4407 domain-containing protein [uncultured Zobellia sp.]